MDYVIDGAGSAGCVLAARLTEDPDVQVPLLEAGPPDASVLSHEWLHYFEHKIGRSDSIGGSHAFGEKMDMRVAWSEGMASGLSAAMRSAGAPLWRLTKPPFLPRRGDSFFREERSKGRTKSTGADFVRGRLFAAHPATPEIGKKMLPASKIPGGYSRPMPRLCRGEFYGQRASENSGNFP